MGEIGLLIREALILMVSGMGIVFAILAVLVWVVNGTAALLARLGLDRDPAPAVIAAPTAQGAVSGRRAAIPAVVAAAVETFERGTI